MPNKTIAKLYAFVIFSACVPLIFSACSDIRSSVKTAPQRSHYDPHVVKGTLKSADIIESSGLAASRCQAGVLWTHNDSGDGPYIFAINTSGDSLGTWKVQNAQNVDWEDIAGYKDASGTCFIYIGEIGDNEAKRREHAIYRIPEPLVSPENANSTMKNPVLTANAGMTRFSYPDGPHNAETLMVDPLTAEIYAVTKSIVGPAGVYRLRPQFGSDQLITAEKIAELSVPSIPNGLLTGGDISPDGRRMVICDYTQAYEYSLPDGDTNFNDIWKQTPEVIDIGKRKQGESICYSADGNSLLAGSEGKNSPLIEVKRR